MDESELYEKDGQVEFETIDWNDLWRKMVESRHRKDVKEDGAGRWSKADAAQYWRRAHEAHGDRIGLMLESLPLSPSCRVLDVGAGPGVLTIPLARRVASVTAVDPSRPMIDFLLAKAEELEIDNIECVAKPWQEVDVEGDLGGAFDIVVASLSLIMPDIEAALRKMHLASLGSVHLLWFAGQPSWHTFGDRIREAVGMPAEPPMPGSDILFNVLYGMGILPHVSPTGYTYCEDYAEVTEAIEHYKERLEIEGDEHDGAIEKVIRDWSVPAEQGVRLEFPARLMRFSWEVNKLL